MELVSIHPFPARMASEIVFKELEGLRSGQVVLDPMSGSGTVLRAAAELGHSAIGFDLDPLAVLMSRVWTTRLRVSKLPEAAESLVQRAKTLRDEYLPWIDDCEETQRYIRFWFRSPQIRALRRLSFCLAASSGAVADAMRVALSRIIITKERGASVARDTSHSRPHRVFLDNDYDVYGGFLLSAKRLAERLAPDKLCGPAIVKSGDARQLRSLPPNSVDAVITSPPYLNAIDYLRGHRLSLVWFGYSVPQLRALRSRCIGTEHAGSIGIPPSTLDRMLCKAGALDDLPTRELAMVRRYAQDVYGFLKEISRIAKRSARVLLVIGNSCLRGVPVWNANINVAAAEALGFKTVSQSKRKLRISRRYLPPPSTEGSGALAARMRTETILCFSTP